MFQRLPVLIIKKVCCNSNLLLCVHDGHGEQITPFLWELWPCSSSDFPSGDETAAVLLIFHCRSCFLTLWSVLLLSAALSSYWHHSWNWSQNQGATLVADALIVLNKAEGLLHSQGNFLYAPSTTFAFSPTERCCRFVALLLSWSSVFLQKGCPTAQDPAALSVPTLSLSQVWGGALLTSFLCCASLSAKSTHKAFGLLLQNWAVSAILGWLERGCRKVKLRGHASHNNCRQYLQ